MYLIECKANFFSETDIHLEGMGISTSGDEAFCTIDLDEVASFNPHDEEDIYTTVRLKCGDAYALKISYPKFRALFEQRYGAIKVIGD